MELSIIFIVVALINIIIVIYKWGVTGKKQMSAIFGWFCAIVYCILYIIK